MRRNCLFKSQRDFNSLMSFQKWNLRTQKTNSDMSYHFYQVQYVKDFWNVIYQNWFFEIWVVSKFILITINQMFAFVYQTKSVGIAALKSKINLRDIFSNFRPNRPIWWASNSKRQVFDWLWICGVIDTSILNRFLKL